MKERNELPFFWERQLETRDGFPEVPASKSTQNWSYSISSVSPPKRYRYSTMSMVSSNSILMISIRVDLDMQPSLLGSPPKATNASRYSSTSPSKSLVNCWSLCQRIVATRAFASSFVAYLSSKNNCIFSICASDSLYPQAVFVWWKVKQKFRGQGIEISENLTHIKI